MKMNMLEQKIRKVIKQHKGHISYTEALLIVELEEEQERLLQILKEEHKALGNYIEKLRK